MAACEMCRTVPFHRIVDEYRDAIGCANTDGDAGKIRDEGIITLQLFTRHAGPIDDGDAAAVDLVPLRHFIGKDGVSLRGKRFHALAKVIFQQLVEHTVLLYFPSYPPAAILIVVAQDLVAQYAASQMHLQAVC